MIRLLYLSDARADITEDDVAAIARHATAANAPRQISGALAFNGKVFCQCLEGERDTVYGLLALIRMDRRHTDVRIIAERDVESRYFSGWQMRWVFDHSFLEIREAMEMHPLPKYS